MHTLHYKQKINATTIENIKAAILHRRESLITDVNSSMVINDSFTVTYKQNGTLCAEGFITDMDELLLMNGIGVERFTGDVLLREIRITTDIVLPKHVSGFLDLTVTKVKNLDLLSDVIVGRSICIPNTGITSLKGIQTHVNGHLDLSNNGLTDLEFLPVAIKGDLNLTGNPLTSLTGIRDVCDIGGNIIF